MPGFAAGTFPCPTCRAGDALRLAVAVVAGTGVADVGRLLTAARDLKAAAETLRPVDAALAVRAEALWLDVHNEAKRRGAAP